MVACRYALTVLSVNHEAITLVITHQQSNPIAIACGSQRRSLALQVGIAPENSETFVSVKGNAHPTTTTQEKVGEAIALLNTHQLKLKIMEN